MLFLFSLASHAYQAQFIMTEILWSLTPISLHKFRHRDLLSKQHLLFDHLNTWEQINLDLSHLSQ